MVPFPAGGTTDVLARLIAQQLGATLGTTVIIDNRGGAGGSVGSELAARAAPDGYTLLGGTISSHAINVSLYPKLGYDPIKSFAPVTLIGTNPVVLVVNQASPYRTLKDVVDGSKAKAASGGLSSASAGTGTSQHLAMELLAYKSGVKFTHIPYKGSGPAIQDVIGGQVDMMFDTTVVAGPHIQSGKLCAHRRHFVEAARVDAGCADRGRVRPQRAQGLRGGVLAGHLLCAGRHAGPWHRGRPAAHRDPQDPYQAWEMQDKLTSFGMAPADMSTTQIAAFQKSVEVDKWAAVIKAANIKPE